MRFKHLAISALTVSMLLFPSKSLSQKIDDAEIALRTKYFSRGIVYSEKPVIQSTINASRENLAASLFLNYSTEVNVLDEADLTLEYSKQVKRFNFAGGYTFYKYSPAYTPTRTQEIYSRVSLEDLFTPTFLAVYDFDQYDGFYTLCSYVCK